MILQDFGSNGIRLGCLISQNNAPLLRAVEANSYFACPSALSDLATSRILSDDTFVENFARTNRLRLADNFKTTAKFLEGQNIPYEKGINAGFFAWVDLFAPIREQVYAAAGLHGKEPGIESEKALRSLEARLQETLLRHRIFLASGTAFGGDKPGWFRIVFAHEKSYLERGLDRVVEALEAFQREIANGGAGNDLPMEKLVIREGKDNNVKP